MKITEFESFSKDVFHLNGFFRGHQYLNETMINNQYGYMISELKELIPAIVYNDAQEFVDAIGDVFVTGIYLDLLSHNSMESYLNKLNLFKQRFKSEADYQNYKLVDLLGFIETIENLRDKRNITESLYLLVNTLDSQGYIFNDGNDTVGTLVLKEISKSNWSKFPLASSRTEEQRQQDIQFIKENLFKKTGEQAEVHYIEADGHLVYLNSKTNKFLKPQSFVEPQLSWVKENDVVNTLCRELHREKHLFEHLLN